LVRGWWTQLLQLLRVNVLWRNDLRRLTRRLRVLQLRWMLWTSGLMLGKVLAKVRLRLRLRRELLLLVLDVLRRPILRRVCLALLEMLFLWRVVVWLLLLVCSTRGLAVQLSVV
jgi:hypothetical protein